MSDNPLLHLQYHTLHNSFPFSRIDHEKIEAAIQAGIEAENAEIDAITSNADAPTFDNTIIALSQTGELLERATTVMGNLLSAHRSDALEALAERLTPVLSKHSSNIMLNAALFARVKTVYENELQHASLQGEERLLLEKTYEGFERSGVTLSEDKQQRFRELKEELAKLTLQFSQNTLKATNDFILHLTDEQQLNGLPESQVEQAAATAAERGLEGWVITLHAPSFGPFMQYAESRELREQLYRAYMTKCAQENEQNNFEICTRLVNLRMELAQLLGCENYAAYVLKNRMAQSADKVQALLDQLHLHYFEGAKQEVAQIKAIAQEKEGEDFELQAWDVAHYAHLLQLRDFNLDAEMLRPYFELSRVIDGVFGLATRLYGISFRENTSIEVYHPEVKAYEIFDQDGSFLALLYTDFFPRSSKQSGAWMTSYQEQHMTQGVDHRPHVSIVMNFSKPTPTKPALLTFSEVETFLHEFGHALHGIFARSRFTALSGTNVYWDFVELPSQLMENFAMQPEFLRTFAQHYETGENLPDELIERLRRARNFNVCYGCIRQVSFGLLDMAYYTRTEALTTPILEYERQAWQRTQLLPNVEGACMTVQFGHIMSGGYAAGYYSYKWAEVLDADAFEAFAEAGYFSTEVASRFRNEILARGGTEHPQTLYKNFRGREATIDALLRRDGLSTAIPQK